MERQEPAALGDDERNDDSPSERLFCGGGGDIIFTDADPLAGLRGLLLPESSGASVALLSHDESCPDSASESSLSCSEAPSSSLQANPGIERKRAQHEQTHATYGTVNCRDMQQRLQTSRPVAREHFRNVLHEQTHATYGTVNCRDMLSKGSKHHDPASTFAMF